MPDRSVSVTLKVRVPSGARTTSMPRDLLRGRSYLPLPVTASRSAAAGDHEL